MVLVVAGLWRRSPVSGRGAGSWPDRAGGLELFRQGARLPAGLRGEGGGRRPADVASGPARQTVVILDYRGAPYLRFSPTGVEVNHNSSMYYLNETPVAQTPPANLSPTAAPSWHRVTGGHTYEWHDGRLHALAAVALTPGVSFVGRWRIPIQVDGQLGSISGGLWHADDPSIVWFWGIVVLVACVLAAWRVRRPALDWLVARVLALAALVAVTIAGLGLQLHGRPTISVFQLVELARSSRSSGGGSRERCSGGPVTSRAS